MAADTAIDASDTKDTLALHPQTKHDADHVLPVPDFSVGEAHPPAPVSPVVIQLMKDKNREWDCIKTKGTSLTLLDLPVDVLRLIVNEASTDLTYTNDLIALALTHSALYKLAVPNIYSRFDIVWPDASAQAQNSKSVDALSYGLATLCLPGRFAELAQRSRGAGRGRPKISDRLTNNDCAKHVRKFSIGDGPPEWTSDYLITKESGKMLGTLVAVAVSRMVNLETFVWDMPTGVLSDVFMALSSHEDDQGQAKLKKVWVRWHDNSTTPSSSSTSSPTTTLPPLNPPPTMPGAISGVVGSHGPAMAGGAIPQPKSYAQSCVEYPTFSILPPLESLTVLDIDDLSYLDEMSVLIERSASQLRELQVGISKKASTLRDFAQSWDGAHLQQVDHEAKWPGESRIPTTRLGGVLGVLVGRIHDIRRKPKSKSRQKPMPEQNAGAPSDEKTLRLENKTNETSQPQARIDGDSPLSCSDKKCLEGKLKLETLGLERVTLSIAVCSRAIDWSDMTSLTILGCQHHEALWKALRRQFQPTPPVLGSPQGTSTRYHLSLKRISTDAVSPALLSFMKETIAPNTMEAIFLQDRQRTAKPSVTLEQVFKSAVKRQRNSLRKLLIDSSEEVAISERWKYWAVKDEFLSYIASGRMASLRELGMVIDSQDWHTLLQQLPQMASLRSLYIPQMLGRNSRSAPAPKELALQIVDIISLRREIRLTYVGLWQKCFEVTEAEHDERSQDDNGHAASMDDVDHIDGNSDGDDMTDDDDDDDEGEEDEGEEGEEEIEPFMDVEDEFTEDVSDDDQSEADSFTEGTTNNPLPRLRLREILYYDEKVELFRARHGKL